MIRNAGGELRVDPEELQRLSALLAERAEAIDAIEMRSSCDLVAAAMPATELGTALSRAGEYVEGAYLRLAQRIADTAHTAAEAAQDYDLQDGEFTQRLTDVDGGH